MLASPAEASAKAGCWMLDAGDRILDAGFARRSFSEGGMPDTGCWYIKNPVSSIPYLLLSTEYPPQKAYFPT
jgi:hypothetical protein